MTRWILLFLFCCILLAMLTVTMTASLDRSILKVGKELTSDPWFQATLADAYFGFLTFYCWVAYKERGWASKLTWFVLIMLLGNIAMASYMLWQLLRIGPEFSAARLLLRAENASIRA